MLKIRASSQSVATCRPHEARLLVACTGPGADGLEDRIDSLIREAVDWTGLVQTAIDHNVSPLLARRLLALPAAAVPEELRGALAAHLRDNAERNVALVTALLEILRALAARGVAVMAFKGQTLAVLAFGDLTARRCGDIDLLFRPEDMPVAWTVLEELGYREGSESETGRPMTAPERAMCLKYQCEYLFVRKADGVVIEPHWAFAPPGLAIRLPYDSFWQRSSTVDVGGHLVPTLGIQDLLLVLCVHGSKHEWTRLQWTCDLAWLLKRYREEEVDAALACARSHGVERMLLIGLGLASAVYGVKLSRLAGDRLAQDPEAACLVEEFANRMFLPAVVTSSVFRHSELRLRMRERWPDRAMYVVRTAFTPTARHVNSLPLQAGPLALYVPVKILSDYLIEPVLGLGRAARSRWQALVRRLSGGSSRRILVVDWVPYVREGAGAPRLNAILRLLAGAGHPVTLHPVEPCTLGLAALRADIPARVEVVRWRGIEHVEAFLAERAGEFAVIMVGRPMNMARFAGVVDRRPELLGHARLVYDSEAIFSMRTIAHRQLIGDPLTKRQQSELIAQEASLASRADAVLAVSRGEKQLLEDCGVLNVHLVGYPIEARPGARPWEQRTGLLFVGRVAEDGWPNAEGLVWYRDHVLPRLEGRGFEAVLTVVGLSGAASLSTRADSRIRFVGTLEDLVPAFDEARVFVAPVRFAAGIPIKICDAAAHGVPVVTTRLMADQLGWRPGEDLLAGECSDAEAFADNLIALYTQPELWMRVRENALRRVAEDFSPARVLTELESAFQLEKRK